MTIDEARNLADRWVAAWNAHDLDLIITHYDDTVELTSPVAAQLLGTSDGKVVGKVSFSAFAARTPNYLIDTPASTIRRWPVTMLDASEARKMHGPTISSGRPSAPRGIFSRNDFINFSPP